MVPFSMSASCLNCFFAMQLLATVVFYVCFQYISIPSIHEKMLSMCLKSDRLVINMFPFAPEDPAPSCTASEDYVLNYKQCKKT